MPTYRIAVVVDPTAAKAGADATKQALVETQAQAAKLQEQLDRIRAPRIAIDESVQQSYAEAQFAVDKLNRGLEQEVQLLKLDAGARQQVAELIEIDNALREKGVVLTKEENAQIVALVAEKARLAEVQAVASEEAAAGAKAIALAQAQEREALESIRGPMLAYQEQLAALNRLLKQGAISQEEYALGTAKLPKVGAGASPSGGAGLLGGLGEAAPALAGAAAVFGGIEAAHGIVELGDDYTSLQNRIRQVTSSEEALSQTTKDLFEISNQTRTSVDENAAVFQRTAVALDKLGYSTRTSIGITKELDEIVVESGASTSQSSRALIEFSEALGKGKLQGQEFRSIIKEVPGLANEIQRGLGVSTEKFHELIGAGALTTDQLVKALRNVSEEVDAKFAKTVPTASSVLEVLRNDLEQFVGEVVGGTGPALVGLEGQFKAVLTSLAPAVKGFVEFTKAIVAPAIADVANFIRSDAEAFSHFADVLTPLPGQLDAIEASLTPFKALEGVAAVQDELINSTEQLTAASTAGFEANQKIHAQEKNDADVRLFYAQRQQALDASRLQDAEHLAKVLQQGGEVSADQLVEFTTAQQKGTEAAQEHEKELDNLLGKITPATKAQHELAVTSSDLLELVQRGTITYGQATAAINAYSQANVAALDPEHARLDSLVDQIDALEAYGTQSVKAKYVSEQLIAAQKSGQETTGAAGQKLLAQLNDEGAALQKATDDHNRHTKAQEAGATAAHKHATELANLLDRIDRVAKAQHELAVTTADLSELVGKHRITVEQASDALKDWHAQNDAILDPLGHVQAALAAETAEQALSAEARERAVKLREVEAEITGKGVVLTDAQTASLEKMVDAYYDEIDARAAAKTAAEEEQKRDQAAIEARKQWAQVESDIAKQTKKDLADAAKQREEAVKRSAENGDLGAGASLALKKIRDEAINTAPAIEHAFTSTFDNLNKSILSFVETGKFGFASFAQSAIAALDELALKLLESKILQLIFPAAGVGRGGNGIASIFGGSVDLAQAFATGGSMGPYGAVHHAATGYSAMVGGSGGTDSQLRAFWTTPGERIDILTPEQQHRQAQQLSGVAGAAASVVNVDARPIIMDDASARYDVFRTPRGEREVLDILRRNRNAVKNL